MRRALGLLGVVLGCGLGSIASACPPPLPEAPAHPRVGLGEVGFDHSGGVLPGVEGVAIGFGVRYGKRVSPALVPRLEGDVWIAVPSKDEASMDTPHALYSRAGVASRWVVGTKSLRGAALGWWLDAGLGVGRSIAGDGNTRTITDVMVGVGGQLELADMDRDADSKWMGGYLAVRALFPTDDTLSPGVLISAGYVWGR